MLTSHYVQITMGMLIIESVKEMHSPSQYDRSKIIPHIITIFRLMVIQDFDILPNPDKTYIQILF